MRNYKLLTLLSPVIKGIVPQITFKIPSAPHFENDAAYEEKIKMKYSGWSRMVFMFLIGVLFFKPFPAFSVDVSTSADLKTSLLNGDSVVLLNDLSDTVPVTTVVGKNITTINMNGKNVSPAATTVFLTNSASVSVGSIVDGKFSNFLLNPASSTYGLIYNLGDITTISGNTFASNTARNGGAITNRGGTIVEIKDNIFSSNHAKTGAAIHNRESGVISKIDSTFEGNNTDMGGGAIHNSATIGSIKGTFTENTAGIINSSAQQGGAIYNQGSIDSVSATFDRNGSVYSGGAIFVYSTGSINSISGIFTENYSRSQSGGAIAISSNASLGYNVNSISGTFTGNTAERSNGGAISIGAVSVVSSVRGNFTSNSARGGGAISVEGSANITDSVFYSNESTFANAGGGALYNEGTTTIKNSTFDQNTSMGRGGAIYSNAILNVQADNGITLFSYNLDSVGNNAIYMGGTSAETNLSALNDGVISFDGSIIASNTAKLSIGGDASGVIKVNNIWENLDITQNNATTNILDVSLLNNNNSLLMAGGTLNLNNLGTTDLHFRNFAMTGGTIDLQSIDVDLYHSLIGKISADTYGVSSGGVLNVNSINVLSDAKADITTLSFADSSFAAYINTPFSYVEGPTWFYDLHYDDATGQYTFVRRRTNPNVNIPVAQISSNSIGLISEEIYTRVLKDVDNFVLLDANQSQANFWVKPFASKDALTLRNFEPTVDSLWEGVVAGFNGRTIEFKNNYNITIGGYSAFAHGEQKYRGNKISQNGGYLGTSVLLEKENFFTKLTANLGYFRNNTRMQYGKDAFNSFVTGVGMVNGFSIPLTFGFYALPNVYSSYTYLNTENYENAQRVDLKTKGLRIIEVAPELKFVKTIGENNSVYAQCKYTKKYYKGGELTANDILLPEVTAGSYAEYGLGWTTNMSQEKDKKGFAGFLEIARREVSRQGWSMTLGVQYSF